MDHFLCRKGQFGVGHSFIFVCRWLTTNFIVSRIDLSNASEVELEHLSAACQPATFGVNQEDVLDESYRKAGKMDVTDFSPKFNLADSSLMDVVRSELLEGHESNKAIRAELYKLNIYGKAHGPRVLA
jgi:hypothetical protein